MSKHRKILGKSLSDILEEEITPEKVLAGNKLRSGSNTDTMKKYLYKEYLKNKDSLLVSPQGSSR